MGDTFDKVKEGIKKAAGKAEDSAEKVGDPDTYKASNNKNENREYNQSGGNEPMNPEDIAAHEATAVKRDQDSEIAEQGQTGTDSPEAREKFKKSGMTDAK
jgi:hypothetical protein